MVIDNFTSYDLQWMISDKALSFFRVSQPVQPVNVANDNMSDAGNTQLTNKKPA